MPTVQRLDLEHTEISYYIQTTLKYALYPTEHRQHTKLDAIHNIKLYNGIKKLQWSIMPMLTSYVHIHLTTRRLDAQYPALPYIAKYMTYSLYTYHELILCTV